MIRYFVCFIFTLSTLSSYARTELDSLLRVLDMEIIRSKEYMMQKEERIRMLKEQASNSALSQAEVYSLNKQLFNEYRIFMCDSAIKYMNLNLELAEQMEDREKFAETVFMLSTLLSSSALYKESEDVLRMLPREQILPEELSAYYACYDHLYGELAYYTNDKLTATKYREISQAYKDSLYTVLDKTTDQYLHLQETFYRDSGDIDRSLQINNIRLARIMPDSPEFASAAFFRALSYKETGDTENYKKYLALSAIADIRNAIKDNASLGILANILYEEGEIERAYNYIVHSFDDANFFNARLRGFQISEIQSIINKTYQRKSDEQNKKLRTSLTVISLLLLLLLIAIVYIHKQMKKLSSARNNLQVVNQQLNLLNREQLKMNEKLKRINMELSDANHIKEEYIGQFLSLCSNYIDKQESYRKMINKQLKAGKTAEVVKITSSTEWMENELKEFYINFDTTFLQIYPDFVKEFNALLLDEEKIGLKKGELLNTELRIFALIRLGIEDSSQIAEFLRYSVNTIYNYRAKVKNKAKVPRDDFEKYVRKIGNINR